MPKQDEKLQEALVVVLANKQDRPESLSAQEVSEFLDLASVLGSHRRWFVQPTSAMCGEGVHEAMDWILANMGEGAGGEGGTGRKGSGILVDKGRHYPERQIKVAQAWRDGLQEEERRQLHVQELDNYHDRVSDPPAGVNEDAQSVEEARASPTEDLIGSTESVNLLISQDRDASPHESELPPERKQPSSKTAALLPAAKAPDAYQQLANADDEEVHTPDRHSDVVEAATAGGVSGVIGGHWDGGEGASVAVPIRIPLDEASGQRSSSQYEADASSDGGDGGDGHAESRTSSGIADSRTSSGMAGAAHTQAQLLAMVMRSGEETSKRVPLIQKINRGEITSAQQLAELGLAIDPAANYASPTYGSPTKDAASSVRTRQEPRFA
eukprot:Tamp_13382.p1 GENE.Tamp_13382~~Tamp_13382.p1  ORF type:complete len:383 (+),score=56.76 Tamp_13382:528-1676(+)